MKTSAIDFIICFSLYIYLLASSILFVLFGLAPTTHLWLGDYHIIADYCLYLIVFGLQCGLLIQIILKISPLKMGEFSMDDKNFTVWKILSMTYYTGYGFLQPLTKVWMRPMVLSLFGAKMGKDVAIGGEVDCPYLTTIGDYSLIGNGSHVYASYTVKNKITIGKIKIGDHVTVGINSVILPDVEIGDHAIIEIGSVVMPGSRVPAGERWRGNPARKWI